MNRTEKIIQKLVAVLMLLFSLGFMLFNYKLGGKSFGIHFIPLIFVLFSLYGIFQNYFSRLFTKVFDSKIFIKPKEWIEKNSLFVFFILPLSIFSIIGFTILFFAIKLNWDVDFLGWVTISLFAIFPLILIYGFIFGFSISEKRQKEIEDRLDSLSATEKGMSIELKIFDKTCFVSWNSIDAIIYYNFYVSSDFTEYYEGYKLYLNTIPVYTKYEKQWWLNKLFPKDSKSKVIDIKVDTRGFGKIPNMIEDYLKTKTTIDFSHPMKGTLISSKIYNSENKTQIIEKWKPNSSKESEQIIFNKLKRTIEEIKKNYR